MQLDLHPPATDPAFAVRPDEGRAAWLGGVRYLTKVDAAQTGGAFALVEAVAPAWAGAPPHVHTREAEALVVLAGTFEVLLGERTVVLEAGAVAYVPAWTVHAFVNVGPVEGRLLSVLAPGGFEGYFAAAGSAAEGEPASDTAALARLLAHAPAYGLTFPPPLED